MAPKILLSFDVEEFDMPLEYHQNIHADEQMKIGKEGLDIILPILDTYGTPCTMFTTANFAQTFSKTIKAMAATHEIASHTFYHSNFEDEHLLSSKEMLEKISGQKVYGLRMPRMKKIEMSKVADAGYSYDSSVNPTFLPGRYNNLHVSRTIYNEDGMLRLPASVSPMRIPLFWLSFKNFPYSFFLSLCKRALKKDGYVCLYFHPWEFTNISNYGLPKYTCEPNGVVLTNRLIRLINDLKKAGTFSTIKNYLEERKLMRL